MKTSRWPTLLSMTVTLALGCATVEESVAPPQPDEPQPSYLEPTQHLVRVAMALKGTRPTLAELRAVQSDPAALDAIVDGYLESDAFGVTMRDLHNDTLFTRASKPA